MRVKVNQCHGLPLATQIRGQVSRNRALANAALLTGNQDFECGHFFSAALDVQC